MIAWNRAIEEMTVKKAEILGKGDYAYAVPFYGKPEPMLVDLVLNPEAERQYDFLERRGNDLYSEGAVSVLHGGKGASLFATASPLYDAAGKLIGAIESIRDITERKRAEEELTKTRGLLESAVLQSSLGIVIADAPNVKIRYANAAAFDIRGETDQALTELDVSEHPRQWQIFMTDGVTPYSAEKLPLSRAVLEGVTSENVDVIMRRDTGENRWISVNASPVKDSRGNITAGLVVLADITERKKTEEEHLRLATAIEQAGEVILITDPAGKIRYANPAFGRTSGYTPAEVIDNGLQAHRIAQR